jgi:hypothetical protein
MINAKIYTDTISANATIRRLYSGALFKIISSTGALNVRTDLVDLSSLVSGQGFQDAPYQFLELKDASGASNTVRYVVATEGFLDGITGSMQITQNVPVRSGSFANTAATVTNASAQLVAANSARTYLLIQNKDASGNIFVNFGSAAATVANGIKIGPGGNFEMSQNQSTQDLQCIGDMASNTNILVVEG